MNNLFKILVRLNRSQKCMRTLNFNYNTCHVPENSKISKMCDVRKVCSICSYVYFETDQIFSYLSTFLIQLKRNL